jgi:hypothetical protein
MRDEQAMKFENCSYCPLELVYFLIPRINGSYTRGLNIYTPSSLYMWTKLSHKHMTTIVEFKMLKIQHSVHAKNQHLSIINIL